MPRVSAEHRAARRQQILDAAQLCFSRRGFHATTMQDVIAEADLSVGAVYRYFKGKDDIIEAIAESYSNRILAAAAPVGISQQSVADSMRAAIDVVHNLSDSDGPIRLAMQVWAEAVRDERIGVVVRRVYGKFREVFVAVAARGIDSGELSPEADPAAVGAALFSLALGYGVQRALTGGPEPSAYLAGLSALLDRVLAGDTPTPPDGASLGGSCVPPFGS